MTKHELSQHYYLNREIMHDTDRLLRIKSENRLQKGEEAEETAKLIEIREGELRQKIKRCTALKNEIERFIDSIDDSLTRQIFYYRYIKCMSWRKVSYMTGGINSDDGVRKIAERYLISSSRTAGA